MNTEQLKVGDPVRFVGMTPSIAGKEGSIVALGNNGTIAEFAPNDTEARYVVSTLLLEGLPRLAPQVKP